MSELISTLSNLFTLVFVVTSMFSFGLRLTIQQVVEPLHNLRLVVIALAVNFVIVPGAAYLLANLFGLSADLRIGLILVSVVAGAAFATKLAQIARGDLPLAVALTALLVVATVIYLPLVLPLILSGVQVNSIAIIKTLSLQILLPLALGFIVDYLSKDEADVLIPALGQIANISLALMIALMLGSNIGNVISLLGSGAIISIVLLLAIAMVAGYVLGGPHARQQRTLSLVSGQRNLAAAFVVANSSFANRPNVLVFLAAAGLIAMVVVLPVTAQLRKSAQRVEQPAGNRTPTYLPATGGEAPDRVAGEGEDGDR